MAAVPVVKVPDSANVEAVETRFRKLAAVWEAETMFLSDAHRIIAHPAFQEIIGMGETVIPFMLRDLETKAHQWVWALPRITGPTRSRQPMLAIAARWPMPGSAGAGSMAIDGKHIKVAFPKLADSSFHVTSPPDHAYNCIAWAVGVTRRV